MSRPARFKDFVGNEQIVRQAEYLIKVASLKDEQLPHLLLAGSPGSGKTTIANIIAIESNEIYLKKTKVPWGDKGSLKQYLSSGDLEQEAKDILNAARIIKTTGSSLRTNQALEDILFAVTAVDGPEDGGGIMDNHNEPGEIKIDRPKFLFIDEAHNINKRVMDDLLIVLEQFVFYPNAAIDAGENFKIPKFCCIMATTNPGSLSTALISRFGATLTFEDYNVENDFHDIVINHVKSKRKDASITSEAVKEISKRAQGVVRLLIQHTDKCFDMLLMNKKKSSKITKAETDKVFEMFGIDKLGLTVAKEILVMKILSGSYPRSVGIKSLGEMAYMDKDYILKDVEPYLVKLKFVERVPNGRVLTKRGLDYIVSEKHILPKTTLADLRR